MRGARLVVLLALLSPLAMPQPAAGQRLFKRFLPVNRVEASPTGDYTLTTDHGPWLVMACTFSGKGAEQQARELILEFRERFNLPAYLHAVEFDRSDETVGRGIDEFGEPVRMKYRQGNRLEEWAVLVGEFQQVDDPSGQKLLKTIKAINPAALALGPDGETAQNFAVARSSASGFSREKELGPMRAAFVARNPLLPREYFVPKGVDKTVEKWNRGVDHSLLSNPKRYTVKVATFRGQDILQGAKNAPKLSGKRNRLEPLEEAALNAHLLTEEMRKAGIEAYEFHDRNESIVTVGGFDEATRRAPDGSLRPLPAIVQIIQKFDAGYNTPTDPLQHAQLSANERARVDVEKRQRLQQFNNMLTAQRSQVAGGMKPKFARIPPDSKNAKVIPFDIHPQVVEVPKKSISAGFAWR